MKEFWKVSGVIVAGVLGLVITVGGAGGIVELVSFARDSGILDRLNAGLASVFCMICIVGVYILAFARFYERVGVVRDLVVAYLYVGIYMGVSFIPSMILGIAVGRIHGGAYVDLVFNNPVVKGLTLIVGFGAAYGIIRAVRASVRKRPDMGQTPDVHPT